jgi:CRISPR-associated endoribonuclease Cas6
VGTSLYNGRLSIKEFPIYNIKITNPFVSYIKEYSSFQNAATFKTLSPIVIRHYQKKDRYILPNEEELNQSFNNALIEQLNKHKDINFDPYVNIGFKILRFKKVVMTHYRGLVLGFTGILQMFANSTILQFFYQCGLGYRRSNGFGLLSIQSK